MTLDADPIEAPGVSRGIGLPGSLRLMLLLVINP